VYVSVNTISIFSGSIKIMDIEKKMLNFFFIDSTGIRNTKIFKKKKPADDNCGILKKKIGMVQFKGVNLTIYD
jgi:hypothetical protein